MAVATLDDLSVADQTIATRIDVNSPLTTDGALADDHRLRAHAPTIQELLDAGGRVGILAHQGRPGDPDFSSLAPHADRLADLLDGPVTYCDAIFSSDARAAVRSLEPGEAVMLENTRFYSEEYMEFEPTRAGETFLVDRLAPEFDAYVNDAFAAAHRSQPSLVGFPEHLPAYAGRVMEQELAVLDHIEETPTPRVYVLGGAKVTDSIDVAAHILETGLADTILTTGVVANVFLAADGVDLGPATTTYLSEHVPETERTAARDLLASYPESITMPTDVAVPRDGHRHELAVSALPPRAEEPVHDIGSNTVDRYGEVLKAAGTAILNGPAGVVEDDRFTDGSRGVFDATTAATYSIVGGGDTAAAIRQFGIDGFDHVSTGGGAALRLLSGASLPAVEALS